MDHGSFGHTFFKYAIGIWVQINVVWKQRRLFVRNLSIVAGIERSFGKAEGVSYTAPWKILDRGQRQVFLIIYAHQLFSDPAQLLKFLLADGRTLEEKYGSTVSRSKGRQYAPHFRLRNRHFRVMLPEILDGLIHGNTVLLTPSTGFVVDTHDHPRASEPPERNSVLLFFGSTPESRSFLHLLVLFHNFSVTLRARQA
jgi:hypothetical protein